MIDRTSRAWTALGTPKAVQIISIGMVIYLLMLGGLTYGYAKVSSCLARYADESANSQAIRAGAAAEDRRLNDAEGRLADLDRARYRADQKAMNDALATVLNPEASRPERAQAFAELLAVNGETGRILDANEVERTQIRQERTAVEARRAQNPVPPPPSETC